MGRYTTYLRRVTFDPSRKIPGMKDAQKESEDIAGRVSIGLIALGYQDFVGHWEANQNRHRPRLYTLSNIAFTGDKTYRITLGYGCTHAYWSACTTEYTRESDPEPQFVTSGDGPFDPWGCSPERSCCLLPGGRTRPHVSDTLTEHQVCKPRGTACPPGKQEGAVIQVLANKVYV